jgi:hypothetical protein
MRPSAWTTTSVSVCWPLWGGKWGSVCAAPLVCECAGWEVEDWGALGGKVVALLPACVPSLVRECVGWEALDGVCGSSWVWGGKCLGRRVRLPLRLSGVSPVDGPARKRTLSPTSGCTACPMLRRACTAPPHRHDARLAQWHRVLAAGRHPLPAS